MKRIFDLSPLHVVFGLFFSFAALATPGDAVANDNAIAARTANIEGVPLHYLTAGKGPTVILLHGYAETSRMWKPIIPLLAQKFTVIAPDLPGIGDSGIPADKIDMETSANRIHALARSLGVEKARVVGHDIGLMASKRKENDWNLYFSIVFTIQPSIAFFREVLLLRNERGNLIIIIFLL